MHFHTFQDDAMGTDDAVALSERLRRGEVSVAELTEAAIARAEQLQQHCPALTSERFEQALSESKTAKQPGKQQSVFSGMPTFVKDNLPTKGHPTSFGSAAVRTAIEKRHDPYAKQFAALGFNILGKSSLPEFGLNASTEPQHSDATCNPWHKGHSAGASSGGAAALVAAGVVPVAHGNDGGGSIRIPAACCGLVGLKPTRGRHVNSLAARALPINLVSEGILTRSVRDTAYFHHEAESHYHNPKLPKLPLILGPDTRRLRIALLSEPLSDQQLDADTQQSLISTAEKLEAMGHHVDPITFPVKETFAEDFPLYWAMMAFSLKHTGKLALLNRFDPDKLDPLTHGLADYFKQRALRTPVALVRLRQQAKRYLTLFGNYDVMLSPTLNQAPPELSHLSPDVPFDELFERLRAYVGFTPLANVAGSPAISLPMGQSKNGLPIGMQFCADIGREDLLLKLAYELEESQPWAQLHHMG